MDKLTLFRLVGSAFFVGGILLVAISLRTRSGRNSGGRLDYTEGQPRGLWGGYCRRCSGCTHRSRSRGMDDRCTRRVFELGTQRRLHWRVSAWDTPEQHFDNPRRLDKPSRAISGQDFICTSWRTVDARTITFKIALRTQCKGGAGFRRYPLYLAVPFKRTNQPKLDHWATRVRL